MAQRRHRHHHGVFDDLELQPHIDELAGKQRQRGVVKTCFGLDGAGGGVHLVVQRSKHARVQHVGAGAIQRGGFHYRACGGGLLQRAGLILRYRKNHGDRVELRDERNAVGVAGVHHVAGIDGAQAHAPAHRCQHPGVVHVQPRRVFIGLVNHHRAFELLDQRGLGIDLLAGNRVLAQQRLVALERDAGAVQLRFVALALAAGLAQRQLKRLRVDAGQQVAGAHHLAFLEQYFLHHARNAWCHFDAGQRRDGAQRIQNDGNMGPLGRRNPHRGGRTPARPAGAATGTGACRAGRMRQVPGQPAGTAQHQHSQQAAHHTAAAAQLFAGNCIGAGVRRFGFRVHDLSLLPATRACLWFFLFGARRQLQG